jgi:hypothetical protein
MSLQFEEDPGKFIEIYNYRITILKSLISTIPLHFHDWLEFLAALDNMNLLYDDILRADNHVIRLQQYLLEMSRCNVGWYQQLLSMNLVNELMDISSYSLNSFASNYLKELRARAHDTPISAQDDEDDDYNDRHDEDDEDYEDYEDDEGDEDDEDDEDDEYDDDDDDDDDENSEEVEKDEKDEEHEEDEDDEDEVQVENEIKEHMKLSDTGVDTLGQDGGNNYDDAGDWTPHPILLKSNINIMNVPGDGNCMLHACTSKLQNLLNICDFTIQQAINMRNVLMDHLVSHPRDQTASGMTLSELAMLRASEIESELKKKPSSRDAIVTTLDDYAHYMRFADPDRCLYTDTPELYLISICYDLNIAVYQIDPCNSQHYVLMQKLYGDKNNTERVVYLMLHGVHYQRIFTVDGSYSYIADGGDGDDGGEESISIIDNNSSSDENNTSHIEESNEPTVVSALLQNHWLKNKPADELMSSLWHKPVFGSV